jgi:hypothetical protein
VDFAGGGGRNDGDGVAVVGLELAVLAAAGTATLNT